MPVSKKITFNSGLNRLKDFAYRVFPGATHLTAPFIVVLFGFEFWNGSNAGSGNSGSQGNFGGETVTGPGMR